MTKARRWVLAGVAVVVVAGIATYVYRAKREADQIASVIAQAMLHGYPAKGVEADAWGHVRIGMTKREVEALLGDAPGKKTGWHTDREVGGEQWWEYGHVSSIFAPAPDNRAYVVYFDNEGRVTGKREPTP